MTTNASEVVIWSADVDEPTLDQALGTEGLELKLVKLDRAGLNDMGLSKIRDVQERGFKVFADAKIAEIPDKVVRLAKQHLAYKPWMLNVMADVSSTGQMTHENAKKIDALKRFAEACHEAGTLSCAVTVLTSNDDEVPVDRFGGRTAVQHKYNGRTAIEQVLTYVEELLQAGFTDVVCSPLEVAAIRAESRFDGLKLNTPGVRLADTSSDDQARTNTPAGAVSNGSDRLVIGRNLTNGNLAENFALIAADLAKAV